MLKYDEDKKTKLNFKDLQNYRSEINAIYKWEYNKKSGSRKIIQISTIPKKAIGKNLRALTNLISNVSKFNAFLDKKKAQMIPKTHKNSFLIKHKTNKSLGAIMKPIDKQYLHSRSKSIMKKGGFFMNKANFHKFEPGFRSGKEDHMGN